MHLVHETRPDTLRTHLHPKQWLAFLTTATEVLFGGAAGPGKSHLMRVAAIVWCANIPGLQVYLFRRVREDLYKNHLEGPKGFRALLASWVNHGWARIAGDEIRFWNGSIIYLCHCKTEASVYQYQGAEIHVLLIDELTHFTEKMYRFLRGRVRMVGIKLAQEYRGLFPRILCAANPGNIGHLFVKNTFISGCQPMQIRQMGDDEGGMVRQYIPARLEDNPSMAQDDPRYEARLAGLGSKTLVAAMRKGDWDVVEGAFFSEWSNEQHTIPPFSLPYHWLRFRSGDWGSASPFSIGWWAVVSDDYDIARLAVASGRNTADREVRRDRDDLLRLSGPDLGWEATGALSGPDRSVLPRGAIIRYREDYGSSGPNKGLKLTAEAVGSRIAKAEAQDPKLAFGVLDPSAFKEDGGPSIGERINERLIEKKLISFHKADNARVSTQDGPDRGGAMGGWDQMRGRLIGTAQKTKDGSVDWSTGRPMIYFFETCVDSIRTIPVLQHDPHRAEDLDTHAEDHAADDVRYACMSRPWIKMLPQDHAENSDAFREVTDSGYSDSTATL